MLKAAPMEDPRIESTQGPGPLAEALVVAMELMTTLEAAGGKGAPAVMHLSTIVN